MNDWPEWSAYLIASSARAMRLCRALNTSIPALLINREKQIENQSTTSQPWTVTRSIKVSMNTANTLECGSWNIRVNTSVMRFSSIELHTHSRPHTDYSMFHMYSQFTATRFRLSNSTVCYMFLSPPRPLVAKPSGLQLLRFGTLFHKISGYYPSNGSFKCSLKTHVFSQPG